MAIGMLDRVTLPDLLCSCSATLVAPTAKDSPLPLNSKSFSPGSQVVSTPPSFKIINQNFNVKEIKCIVWDMDGTLYSTPGGAHFKKYAEFMGQNLPKAEQEWLLAETERALMGKSPFRVGTFYDVSNKVILDLDDEYRILEGVRPDGTPLLKDEMRQLYPTFSREESKKMVAIGDGWGMVHAIGRYLGLTVQDKERASAMTKKYMEAHPEECGLKPDPKVVKFFEEAKKKGILMIVATNAEVEHTGRFLKQLGLADLADKIYAKAGKPHNTVPLFQQILKDYNLQPRQVVSIGDNVRNEITDPSRLGCQTIFIEEVAGQRYYGVDAVVKNLGGVVDLFKSVLEPSKELAFRLPGATPLLLFDPSFVRSLRL